MIKNVAYIILFLIFGVIGFMVLTIDKAAEIPESSNPEEKYEAARPDYNDASAESIFENELGR